jgi:hypothetical protein
MLAASLGAEDIKTDTHISAGNRGRLSYNTESGGPGSRKCAFASTWNDWDHMMDRLGSYDYHNAKFSKRQDVE